MNAYIEYLEKSVQQLDAERQMLEESSRQDEADFVRIKMNIFGIAKTVYEVFQKTMSGDISEAYIGKLSSLRQTWQAAADKAGEYNNVRAVVTEEIKIKTITEIEENFRRIGGGNK